MKSVGSLVTDRKRAQRGGVLSGVLIIVAFLAIICGALTTELSTNFLLSSDLARRAATQATVDSATNLAIDRLQGAPISSGCPALAPVTLNGSTAAVGYLSCYPNVDRRSLRFAKITTDAGFTFDGSYASVSGQAVYLVGDSSGNLYQFPFGYEAPVWTQTLPGGLTGQPLVASDNTDGDWKDLMNLVPIHVSSPFTGCDLGFCVAALAQDMGSPPDGTCYLQADAAVSAQPAVSAGVAFFGDRSGHIFAYNVSETGCSLIAVHDAATQPVVAGPLVFNAGNKNHIYVIASDGTTSRLIDHTMALNGTQTFDDFSNLVLAYPNAVGMAVDRTSVPARMVVTFAGGQVEMVNISSSFGLSVASTIAIGTAVSDDPSWCHCPGGQDVIGIGGANGSLHLLDAGLNAIATLPAGGPAITTTPQSDAVGEWFFGAADGFIYEVQQPAGSATLRVTTSFGSFGAQVASGVVVADCQGNLCAYAGTNGTGIFKVEMDAHDAQLSACVSTAPPACSGLNPRLWAQVEVGAPEGPRRVHVQGWSYYSP